ncbi:DNA starvation/stationary phase protection protein Dps [Plastoroseomonas arctica]|uniref:DNA starvation/stationary phase protection protein Dps n=1 Tax=Plastoroseomonas arctica TaxID=1509237 RepID=A0AAF1K137_9PROT|nr:DNA starvation/stationary phase protection protein Dps [Plastoroseomonas arctica]MBR0654729.1 DNA starvation/stationary phase protection protein Dps [Plastoroseomonas arctica]
MKTLNDVPDNAKKVSIGVLQGVLVDTSDLTNATRQAHWNVKGPQFAGLHKMFEKFYGELNELADEIAERIVQLGAIADGTTQTIGDTTRLEAYSNKLLDGLDHVKALSTRYAALAKSVREGIDSTDEAGDTDTSDLLTEHSRFLDKSLWMLEAHFQK